MPINKLYYTWRRKIKELVPELRKTQIEGFAWLIVGIYESRSVNLSRVSGKIPGLVQRLSTVKRMSRLLKNKAIQVERIYNPIAEQWIKAQAETSQQVKLIIDGTKIGCKHQLLMVSLAYRKRSIPICWSWVPHVKGHANRKAHKSLIARVKEMIPSGTAVLIVGDSEFGTVELLKCLDKWNWYYVFREKSRLNIFLGQEEQWKRLDEIQIKPGKSVWMERREFTKKEIYPVNILIYWKKNEPDPWYLATNLPNAKMAKTAYARRMWIEEMFGDMKKNGFDLERTMLSHTDRLSRLTLAVVLLYVWLVSAGGKVIKNGHRKLVDHASRRDLCIFQIGFRFIERNLINSLSFSISLGCFL